MGACRSLRLLLRGVVVFVVVCVAGAAAPRVGAERQSTIVFGGQPSGVIVYSSGGGGGQGIQLNLLPALAPLPQRFVIEVPAGYKLDLTNAPGETIADASISVTGVDSPSFATGLGAVVAEDPAKYASDPVAQACAPGTHAAVWAVSSSIAGQQVSVTIFVDVGGGPGVGYTLQSCPTGLPGGSTSSAASISIDGLEVLVPPTDAGAYVWHALVTPETGQTYELQALVPLPESVTLAGRYEQKKRTAVLTGRVVEGGKPVAQVQVFLDSSRGGSDLESYETQTKTDGSFSFRAQIRRTTDFDVTVAPASGPCAGTSSAPGGCAGSTTTPPDDAFATVWVSVRGGAVRATRAADQRRAERENLTASDLPPGFQTTSGQGDACENPSHESDLTITGESASPTFVRLDDGASPNLVAARGLARVYRTAKQAHSAFTREARVSTVRCELKGLRPKPKVTALRLAGVPARVRAFRAVIPVDPTIKADADLVFLVRGRSVVLLVFAIVGASTDIEHVLAAKVAARTR